MTDLPVLYSFRRCPYAMRARLALHAGNQHCELREVVLRDKPAEMLAASPKATVPVLVKVDGSVLEESLDIALWALGRNDPLHWLSPPTATHQTMLVLIEQADSGFKHHLDRYKYASRYQTDELEVESARLMHRAEAMRFICELEGLLTGSDFLFGAQQSLADIAIAPFIRQFASTDRDWFSVQPIPQVQRWLSAFVNSTIFIECMKEYPQWQSGSKGIVFPQQ